MRTQIPDLPKSEDTNKKRTVKAKVVDGLALPILFRIGAIECQNALTGY
jgi:hypothetical protein